MGSDWISTLYAATDLISSINYRFLYGALCASVSLIPFMQFIATTRENANHFAPLDKNENGVVPHCLKQIIHKYYPYILID